MLVVAGDALEQDARFRLRIEFGCGAQCGGMMPVFAGEFLFFRHVQMSGGGQRNIANYVDVRITRTLSQWYLRRVDDRTNLLEREIAHYRRLLRKGVPAPQADAYLRRIMEAEDELQRLKRDKVRESRRGDKGLGAARHGAPVDGEALSGA